MLTNLTTSCADYLKIWEPQTPGTLRAFQACTSIAVLLPLPSDMTYTSEIQHCTSPVSKQRPLAQKSIQFLKSGNAMNNMKWTVTCQPVWVQGATSKNFLCLHTADNVSSREKLVVKCKIRSQSGRLSGGDGVQWKERKGLYIAIFVYCRIYKITSSKIIKAYF